MSLAKVLTLKPTSNVNYVMQTDAAGTKFEPVPTRFVSPAELSIIIAVLQDEYHALISKFHLKPWTVGANTDGESIPLPDVKVDFKRMKEQGWTTAPAIGDFYHNLMKPDSKDAMQKQRLEHAREVFKLKSKTVQVWHATELLKLNCF